MKIAERNINNLRYADDTTLMAESRGTKEPLDEGERGEWKSWLKIQHSKTKIMAFGLITSWQIDGEKVETVTDFIFLGSKITVDDDYSKEIKRCLLLERKAMTKKQRHHFVDKGPYSQKYGFSRSPIPVWELDHKEGWVPKNWCFQSVVLEETLEGPLYAEYIMRNAGLEETQAGIKIAGRNIKNLRYANDTTLMAESEEEIKNLLMKVKEESENVGLKLNFQKNKIMASSPITS